jgi:DNA mismatch endonuclease, patch repair protein
MKGHNWGLCKKCGLVHTKNSFKVFLFCDVCGQRFEKYVSMLSEHNFCSVKCKNEWIKKESFFVKNNPAFKEINRKNSSNRMKINNPMFNPITKAKAIEKNKLNPNRPWLGKHISKEHNRKFQEGRRKAGNQKISKLELFFQKNLIDKNIINWKPQYIYKSISNIDIAFPEHKIAVYIDGDYWHNLPGYKERDEKINKILAYDGWIVLRFWEHDIKNNIDNCIKIIKEKLNKEKL